MLDDLYDGTSVSPATEAPAPQPGKRIWILSISQSVDVAAQATGGAADAADAIGWRAKIFDAKLQTNLALQGIQQAIATKADGIILYGIDCATVKAGLEQAKRAKIPVVGMESRACDGRLLTELSYEPGRGLDGLSRAYGSAGVLWLVAQSPTDAKFLELTQKDSQSVVRSSEGYRSTLKSACPDCTNVPVEFTAANFGPGLQQKVQQALAQNPDAVGLWAPYDGLITAGVSAAVMESLSGGNQQKVVLARWLRREPRLLLLDEPTQGVDVGARAEIWQLIRRAVDAGACALVVTSDLEEMAMFCDRALVMRAGRVVGEVAAGDMTEHNLQRQAFGLEETA